HGIPAREFENRSGRRMRRQLQLIRLGRQNRRHAETPLSERETGTAPPEPSWLRWQAHPGDGITLKFPAELPRFRCGDLLRAHACPPTPDAVHKGIPTAPHSAASIYATLFQRRIKQVNPRAVKA